MNSLLVWPVALPLAGALAALLWPRQARPVGLGAVAASLAAVSILVWQVAESGALRHALGGWETGLGIALRADALSAGLLLMSALVAMAVGVYAGGYFADARVQERFLAPLAVVARRPQCPVAFRRSVQPLRDPGTARPVRGGPGGTGRRGGGAPGGAALPAPGTARLPGLPGRGRPGLRSLRHARPGHLGRAPGARAGGLGRPGPDERRLVDQVRSVSAALLAARGPRQRSGAGQCGALRAGGEGGLLHRCCGCGWRFFSQRRARRRPGCLGFWERARCSGDPGMRCGWSG